MVRRFVLVVLACAACATVADLEVNRPEGEAEIADRDGKGTEDGSTPVVDAGIDAATPAEDAGSPVHACGCDAGSACCIRSSSAPACDAPASCTEPGALVVGCVRGGTDGRDCCWKPDGGVALASFGAGCASNTAACQSNDDCLAHGGKCTTLLCKGIALGVCASAAPSWFVCPP